MIKRFTLLGLLILTGSTLALQQGQPTALFRVTSTRVVAEFIAVDKDGNLVDDLKLGDIEILVDGKKQKVDFLRPPGAGLEERIVTPTQSASGSPGKGSAADSTDLAAPPTAILLDSRTMDASNFTHSINATKKFIEESLRDNSPVMIAEIDRGLRISEAFTRDRAKLLNALGTLRPASVYNPLDRDRLLKGEIGSEYFDQLAQQAIALREGLTQICNLLSAWPGRKNIVFFSEGYPINALREVDTGKRESRGLLGEVAANTDFRDPGILNIVQDVVSLANSFGITFYTVDARGLVAVAGIGSADAPGDVAAGPGESAETRARNVQESETGLTEAQLANFQLTQIGNLGDTQNTLLALAAGTNGSAFFNSNDLEAVLRASGNEYRMAYLASFVPSLKGKPKFRRLEVKSKRKDILLRSQAGFTDYPSDQLLNSQLSVVFRQPELFTALTPVAQFQAGQGGGDVVIGVQGSEVHGRAVEDKIHIEIMFFGQVFDEQGKAVSDSFAIQRGFQADLAKEQFQSLASQPLLAREQLKLSPGRYRFVLAVMDWVAGSVGATSQELVVR